MELAKFIKIIRLKFLAISSVPPVSSLYPQPREYWRQRLSRGLGISHNAQ